MDVGYIEPLQRAYERMKRSLFRPFDLGKWVVIGFAAWLSQIGQSGGGSSGFRSSFDNDAGEAIGRSRGAASYHRLPSPASAQP